MFQVIQVLFLLPLCVSSAVSGELRRQVTVVAVAISACLRGLGKCHEQQEHTA